jgi:hypothetical protein
MRDHAIFSPQFWIGETGRELRGHPEAQVVAAYLITCPTSNMIGLYHLGIPTLVHETGLSKQGASKGLRRVIQVGMASYDGSSETVFLPEMARHQLGATLKPGDKRIKAIEKLLLQMAKSPYCKEFTALYGEAYHLSKITSKETQKRRGIEGASEFEPEKRVDQEQDQEQEKEKQAKRKTAPRFRKPILQEVQAYCQSRGNRVDPQTFIDHYESNGWKVGKNPMRDWKAAVRTWERNDFQQKPKPEPITYMDDPK